MKRRWQIGSPNGLIRVCRNVTHIVRPDEVRFAFPRIGPRREKPARHATNRAVCSSVILPSTNRQIIMSSRYLSALHLCFRVTLLCPLGTVIFRGIYTQSLLDGHFLVLLVGVVNRRRAVLCFILLHRLSLFQISCRALVVYCRSP